MRVVLRVLKILFALLFAGVLAGGAVAATLLLRWSRDLPDVRILDQYQLKGTTKVFARDGTLVGVLAPTIGKERADRRPVKLSEINASVVAAIIASEDENFFSHYGFEPVRFGAALYNTLFKRNQQGASTITQQMIRTTLLDNADSVERKVKEIMLSVQAERFFTKEEILTLYLNTAFWGGNLYGIRAAAQAYFGKDPLDLTTAEGLYLASLLPSPNTRFRQLNATRKFMKLRLERMIEGKWLTRKEAAAVWAEPVRPRGWTNISYDSSGLAVFKKDPKTKKILAPLLVNPRVNIVEELRTSLAPYFMFEIRKILNARYPDQAFSGGGLRVYTTLDPKAQRAAEAAVTRARRPRGTEQVAAVAIDPYTGEIRAMVGGRDQSGTDEYNRAGSTQFRRNPGSSIKPLLYAAGIEKGLEQWSLQSNNYHAFYAPGNPPKPGCSRNYYCPRNFPGSPINDGSHPLRFALDWSLNLPTIHILNDVVTPAGFRDKLRLLGFDVPENMPLASGIGGGVDASPLKMASAFASFVNGGYWIEPSYIRRIETADGRVLFPLEGDEPKRRRVWSPQVAYIALDMIRGVVNDPKGISGQFAVKALIPGRDVAGKTGTTNDVVDMWFLGTTPTLTSAVWMGNDDNKPMPQNAYSGEWMPPIWQDLVSNALAGTAKGSFREPKYIAYRDTYGVKMAYSWQREDIQQTQAAPPAPPPEEDTPPQRPEVQGIPSDGQARVIIAVNICTTNAARVNPRADEFTPPRCIQNQSVLASDLEFYDPNWQPPPPPPAPPAPPPVVPEPPVIPGN